ncbi:MAG: T9SS type A sorting domain-containing protein [Flavobacteriales bacterium]|nr:T9SS type A sorting domain-containing protein [Flavobacteriales bacterium]
MKKTLFLLPATLLISSMVLGQVDGLDQSFGTNGIVKTSFLTDGYYYSVVNGLVVQPDQKIITAGIVSVPYQAVACRYNTDGTLDESFGTNGKSLLATTSLSYCDAVALKDNGQILLGGTDPNSQFCIMALDNAGALDATFNSTGISAVAFGVVDSFPASHINKILVLSDEKILVAGHVIKRYDSFNSKDYFGVARLLADGTIDNTFGNNGTTIIYGTESAEVLDIVYKRGRNINIRTQSDGKVIVCGTSDTTFNISGQGYSALVFTTVRLTEDGILDPTFGNNGIIKTFVKSAAGWPDYEVTDNAPCLHVLGDDKIIVAGFAVTDAGRDFAMVRYNADGSIDNTFGTNGFVITNPSLSTTLYANDEAHAIHVFDDGRILLAGFGWQPSGSAQYLSAILAMYTSDGQLDANFHDDGIKGLSLAAYATYIEAIAIQDDGTIVIGGRSAESNGGETFSTLARLDASTLTASIEANFSETKNNFVYPNPNNGDFKIRLNTTKGLKISVYDTLGQCCFAKAYSNWNESNKLTLNNLSDGLYVLKMEFDTTVSTCKFLLQK